jgi:hypothetical protein
MMIHNHERYGICMKGVQQQGLAASTDDESPTRWRRRRRRSSTSTNIGSGRLAATALTSTVDLHALLLQCAQAMAAHGPQPHIRRESSATGDAVQTPQRLAHCYAEGLEARLADTGSHLYHSFMLRRTSVVDFLKA